MIHTQRRSSPSSQVAARARLIAATQGLLATGGADSLSSRSIATAAAANLGAITYYFGSKEQLVTEAMVAGARDLLAPVIAILRSDEEPTMKLLEAVAVLDGLLRDHRQDLAGYIQAIAASSSNASIADALQTLHREMAQLLADEIERQRSVARLPQWVSPAAMARLILAVVHGTLIAAVVDPTGTDETAIGSQFVQLLLGARTR